MYRPPLVEWSLLASSSEEKVLTLSLNKNEAKPAVHWQENIAWLIFQSVIASIQVLRKCTYWLSSIVSLNRHIGRTYNHGPFGQGCRGFSGSANTDNQNGSKVQLMLLENTNGFQEWDVDSIDIIRRSTLQMDYLFVQHHRENNLT